VGDIINVYRILAIKPEGKRRPIFRWENNIKMDIELIGREGVDWIHLVDLRG
jgi:hypothetical protein